RQRVGITSKDAAIAWVAETVKKATTTKKEGHITQYITEMFDIVCDGMKVVTVKPNESQNSYLDKFNDVVTKEATKMLAKYRRELRKAEIAVAEEQLNFLKAKNPKIKSNINERMTEAIDKKVDIEDEIRAVELAARRYGVEAK